MTKLAHVPMGYKAVGWDGADLYLCVPDEDALAQNWNTEEAIIVDSVTGEVSPPMFYQAAFKWVPFLEYSEKET